VKVSFIYKQGNRKAGNFADLDKTNSSLHPEFWKRHRGKEFIKPALAK